MGHDLASATPYGATVSSTPIHSTPVHSTVCAIIPARGGSKGVPRKNLRRIGGQPLIARAVQTLRASAMVDWVIVSTDDPDIAAAARQAGARVIDRPARLAGDEASSESAVEHALAHLCSLGVVPDVTVFVQATSPFLSASDIDRAVTLVRSGDCDVAFSAARCDVHLWRERANGLEGVNHDAAVRQRRQDREPEFAETGGFYAMRSSGFRQHGHRFFGRLRFVEVDPGDALDIDTEHDLALAELIDSRRSRSTTPPPRHANHGVPHREKGMTMSEWVQIGEEIVGHGRPTYVIGEIGINHNGDVAVAKKLIDVAALAGAQAVKFQKRTPDLSTPADMKATRRETPWGEMSYLDYRYRVEFDREQYAEIGAHAIAQGVDWFASPWDVPSVEFLEDMGVSTHKVASASVTDLPLLRALAETGKPIILSTGMSTIEQIDRAVEVLGTDNLVMMHATSTYPLPPEEANLHMIPVLSARYRVPIGYSGHERGLQISIAAVTLGATAVERHITLDRAMWGSDQASSLEPHAFMELTRDIRIVEKALGDGIKRIEPGEHAQLKRLRRVTETAAAAV